MKTIWKYELKTINEQKINIPLNSEVLTVQIQNGVPCLWALVDTIAEKEEKTILILGTGNPVGDTGDYIGTYQLHNGQLVFHVFHS